MLTEITSVNIASSRQHPFTAGDIVSFDDEVGASHELSRKIFGDEKVLVEQVKELFRRDA
jgi:hypothetical protein